MQDTAIDWPMVDQRVWAHRRQPIFTTARFMKRKATGRRREHGSNKSTRHGDRLLLIWSFIGRVLWLLITLGNRRQVDTGEINYIITSHQTTRRVSWAATTKLYRMQRNSDLITRDSARTALFWCCNCSHVGTCSKYCCWFVTDYVMRMRTKYSCLQHSIDANNVAVSIGLSIFLRHVWRYLCNSLSLIDRSTYALYAALFH